MFERTINKSDVSEVLSHGEIITEYPDDKPFPSCLMLGFIDNSPLHVVVAWEKERKTCHIVTVYTPNPAIWDRDFKKRR